MLITITIVILLAALAVAMIMGMRGRTLGSRNRSGSAGYVQGTLTITGVTDRPEADSKGQAFCTVSGTINGPETQPTEVYGTMIIPEGQPWPQMGSDHPVTYKPGKVTSTWQFGSLPPAPPPAAPPSNPTPPPA